MDIHKVNLDGHDVFISQREDNFRVVKPWRNEDGTFNWFNFMTGGSWKNLILVAAVVIIILGVFYEYSTNINTLLDCFRVPGKLQICMETFGTGNINLCP